MKKNVLALSIAAMIGGLGFAGIAAADVVVGSGGAGGTVGTTGAAKGVWIPNATTASTAWMLSATNTRDLSVTQGGTGHSLVVPYFNAQNGNMTVLHVVNTDQDHGKLAKVRFRSAANSDDILDFQVFLSPGDVWTAAVTAGSDGVAQLTTADGTCTLPALAKGVSQRFVTDRLSDKAGDVAAQTREGYVEIFNMADIDGNKFYGTNRNANSDLYTAIKHVNGTAPCTSSVLNQTLDNITTEAAARTLGLDTPTTGLMGDWYIINVGQSTTFAGAATALTAVTTVGGTTAGRGNFVHFPQIDTSVSAASIDQFTADPLLRTRAYRTDSVLNKTGGKVSASVALAAGNYDLPDMSTPYLAADLGNPKAQAIALTSALAVTSVTNQYANDESISAKTDWVFSMPTRRYAVAVDYAAKSVLFNNAVNTHFTSANTSLNATTLQACVTPGGAMKGYSREEDTQSTFVISPDTALKLCGETSVLTFGSEKVLKASIAARTVPVNYAEGWLTVGTTGLGNGLPVIGYAATKAAGATNLGGTWMHRTSK